MTPAVGGHIRHARGGAVQVEFLLAFVPLFILMLALVQFALICVASIFVHHAAARTVRAAVVVLPDKHEDANYNGDPLHQLASGEGLSAYQNTTEGGRFQQIRRVAVMLLSPLAPSIMGAGRLEDALRLDAIKTITGLALTGDRAVAVTFRDGDGRTRTRYAPTETVFVTVSFLFTCAVPVVSQVMCASWAGLSDDARQRFESNRAGATWNQSLFRSRFAALEATAFLPNQGVAQ